jgi:hypothetical protein
MEKEKRKGKTGDRKRNSKKDKGHSGREKKQI